MNSKIKVIKVEKDEFEDTEVTLRAHRFQNFGQRMGDLERMAFEAGEADKPSPEEVAASMDRIDEARREELRKKLAATPEGPKKQLLREILEMLESEPEDEPREEPDAKQEPGDDGSFKHSLEELRICIPRQLKWDKATQGTVEKFLADWPKTRAVVLRAVFKDYKKRYSSIAKALKGYAGLKFVLPKPEHLETVADLFCVASVYLHRNGFIGLGCRCTWDEEHGCGILLKGNKVVRVGEESEAFD